MEDIRFGVTLMTAGDRKAWMDTCRRAEDLGYTTLSVPDHLGMPSPFLALALAAQATSSRVRLGTLVINSSFYNPTLLARDAVGADLCTDGRLELGLGAGYARGEFDKAGLPFAPPGARVDHLERTLDELRRFCDDPHEPRPLQRPTPPVLIAGSGNRVLSLAARRANVVGLVGMDFDGGGRPSFHTPERFAERITFVRDRLRDRAELVRFNVLVQRVVLAHDRASALDSLTARLAGRRNPLNPVQLGDLPTFLVGSPGEIAEQLLAHQERFGIGYVTVLERDLDAFAAVIRRLG